MRAGGSGWRAGGIGGAAVAPMGFSVPCAALVLAVARLWGRWRGSVWHTAVERGMAPVAAGLFLSGGIAVLRASPGGPAVWVAAIATTLALLRWPKMHPVPLLLGGAALFGVLGAL